MRQSDKDEDEYDEGEYDEDDTEAVVAEPADYADADTDTDVDTADNGPPDVYLDVPVLNIDEVQLNVQDLRAHVSLQAEVLDLLKLNVGADVALGSVDLDIKGVEAQAQLKVRLHNVAIIVNRVLTTIDRHPEILEQLSRGLGQAVEGVGTGTGSAVREIGRGTGEAAESVGEGAGAAVEDVGEGTADAAKTVGESAGRAAETAGEDVGGAVGDTAEDVGGAVDDTAEDVGGAVGDTAEDVGGAVDDTAGNVGKTARNGRKPVRAPEVTGGAAERRRTPRSDRTARRRETYKR